MNVWSVFSGIGGLDEGLRRAGHEHILFCEADVYRRDVLRARFRGVPVFDDVAALRVEPAARAAGDGRVAVADGARRVHTVAVPGLLAGGFPCQDVSVAGRRAGLAGDRSGLFHEYARIAESLRPRWLLVENVPGLLSSNGGRDFGVVLGTLADLGYGVAWRILDSRFFGVPQRRRRVFIVGTLADGDPRAAAGRAGEVLAVGSRCPGHPPAGTQAGQDVAGTLGGGAGERGWAQDTERMTFLPTAYALAAKDHGNIGQGHNTNYVAAPLTKGSATGEGVNAPGRRQEDDVNIVAFHPTGGGAKGLSVGELAPGVGFGNGGQVAIGTLREHVRPWSNTDHTIVSPVGVRRLTPRECERLQGLPDDWTLLNDKTPDSRRYSALGDAVTANVAEWIGRRLDAA